MATYKTSNGERLTKSVIDNRIRKAKAAKLKAMLDEQGYIACENCGVSGGARLDCSHNISVKECQETGRSELAYDVKNITVLCRQHHIEFENNRKKI